MSTREVVIDRYETAAWRKQTRVAQSKFRQASIWTFAGVENC